MIVLEREELMDRRKSSWLLLTPVFWFAMVTGAAAAGADGDPVVEPEAAQTLKAALERIARAASFTYRAEVTSDTALPSGQKLQFSGTLEVAVRRPDGLWSFFDGEQRTSRSWYDGKTFTLLNCGKNVYARWPAPDKLDELLGAMRGTLGFTPPLSPLLRENAATKALTKVKSGFTVGRSVIGGVPCRHLAFRGEKSDWQVWISEEGEPLLKRIVITYKQEAAAPQYAATFLAWDFTPRLTDETFRFTPPQGAIQCEFEQMKR
jgi:hypothetical protein